jgi:hypothetical protein
MNAPVRLQLSRRKGFNLQALSLGTNGLPAVTVARPTKWGNPWSIIQHGSGWWFVDGPGAPVGGLRCGNQEGAQLVAVKAFRVLFEGKPEALIKLRAKNLACWCKPGAPCHADVLLDLANRPVCEEVD